MANADLRSMSINGLACHRLRKQSRIASCALSFILLLYCNRTIGATNEEFPIGDLADFLVEVTQIAHEHWVLECDYDTRTVTLTSREEVFFERADEGGSSPPILSNDTHRNKSMKVRYVMVDTPLTTYEDYHRRCDELFNQLDGNARKWLRYDGSSREPLSRDEWMILLKYKRLLAKEGPGHHIFGYRYKALRVWVQQEGFIVEDSSDVATHLQADLKTIEALLTSKE